MELKELTVLVGSPLLPFAAMAAQELSELYGGHEELARLSGVDATHLSFHQCSFN